VSRGGRHIPSRGFQGGNGDSRIGAAEGQQHRWQARQQPCRSVLRGQGQLSVTPGGGDRAPLGHWRRYDVGQPASCSLRSSRGLHQRRHRAGHASEHSTMFAQGLGRDVSTLKTTLARKNWAALEPLVSARGRVPSSKRGRALPRHPPMAPVKTGQKITGLEGGGRGHLNPCRARPSAA